MSLQKKMYLGFAVMILLAAFTGAMGIRAFWMTDALVMDAQNKVVSVSDILIPANQRVTQVYTDVNQATLFLRAYSFNRLAVDYDEAVGNIGQIDERIAALTEMINKPEAAAVLTQARQDMERAQREFQPLQSLAEDLHASIGRSDALQEQIDAEIAAVNALLRDLHDAATAEISAQLADINAFGLTPERDRAVKTWRALDSLRDALGLVEVEFWQGRGKYGEAAAANFANIDSQLAEQEKQLQAFLTSGLPGEAGVLEKYKSLAGHLTNYARLVKDFSVEWKATFDVNAQAGKASGVLTDTFDQMDVYTADLSAKSAKEARESTEAVQALVNRSIVISIGILAASVLIGAVLAFLLTRSIVRPINTVITSLCNGEAVIGKAASQLNQGSRDLSEGVTVQSASLEKTSAALE
ncbi:MAG: hypothetical protein LBV79_09075 [Candidatus Adiutrix sp.]|jgi:hypothetical protein|nr:hypothetical protein [Candidatus Adiutrix sp.]